MDDVSASMKIDYMIRQNQASFLTTYPQVTTASYIIYKSGSTIYSKDGTTGSITRGIDISTSLNTAINNLPNGGKIFVRSGIYDIHSEININRSGIIIEGESFYGENSSISSGTIFNFFNDFHLFNIAKGTDLIEGVILKNFRANFTGSTLTHNIIYSQDMSYSLFKNLYLSGNGANMTGVYLTAVNKWVGSNNFENVIIRGTGTGTCLSIQSNPGTFATVNNFFSCRFWQGGIGVDIHNEAGKTGDVDYNNFTNCVFDTTTSYGVKDNGTGNSFLACTFMDTVSGKTYSGQANSNLSYVTGCRGLYNKPIENLGSNLILKYNPGFKTENSGISIGTGAQQTVVHGLSITPNRQQISLTPGSATASPYHSADPDATNIYITAALNQPWYWATVGT